VPSGRHIYFYFSAEDGHKAITKKDELALFASSNVTSHHNHKQITQTYKTLIAINTMIQIYSTDVIFHHIHCKNASRKLLVHKYAEFSPAILMHLTMAI
jgi:hypothetical protein